MAAKPRTHYLSNTHQEQAVVTYTIHVHTISASPAGSPPTTEEGVGSLSALGKKEEMRFGSQAAAAAAATGGGRTHHHDWTRRRLQEYPDPSVT